MAISGHQDLIKGPAAPCLTSGTQNIVAKTLHAKSGDPETIDTEKANIKGKSVARRSYDQQPSEGYGRTFESPHNDQRRHHTYPRQEARQDSRPPTHWQPEHYQGHYQAHHQGRRNDRTHTQRRDDQGYHAQRPQAALGRDARRQSEAKVSLNDLFKRMQGDLKRHGTRTLFRQSFMRI